MAAVQRQQGQGCSRVCRLRPRFFFVPADQLVERQPLSSDLTESPHEALGVVPLAAMLNRNACSSRYRNRWNGSTDT